MEPIEEARHYLRMADQLREMPFPQFGSMGGAGLADLEKRDRDVLQLHIRAMVAAAEAMQRPQPAPPPREAKNPPKRALKRLLIRPKRLATD